MKPKEKDHLEVIIGSTFNSYRQARLGKKINTTDIYLLNLIYEFLNGCCVTITDAQKVKLEELYGRLYVRSKMICKNLNLEQYKYSKQDTFSQVKYDNFKDENDYIFTQEFNNVFS